MDVSKYRHLYVSETQENLEELSRRLVDLEGQPGRRESSSRFSWVSLT